MMARRSRGTGWRIAAIVLIGMAMGLAGFTWWGLCTVAGRQAYDEMAGIIPVFAGVVSPLLFVGGLAAGLWARRLGKRNR